MRERELTRDRKSSRPHRRRGRWRQRFLRLTPVQYSSSPPCRAAGGGCSVYRSLGEWEGLVDPLHPQAYGFLNAKCHCRSSFPRLFASVGGCELLKGSGGAGGIPPPSRIGVAGAINRSLPAGLDNCCKGLLLSLGCVEVTGGRRLGAKLQPAGTGAAGAGLERCCLSQEQAGW
ncbi:thymidylate synthase [Platysternon megacephalum]|uniref:Thymidylate synthase n=1 Tax=Platysternon megacephalum TaxID=55544 RepID=A0A4D9DKV7_9SAUR|nr:thymidylate synthase [Platysternon megacephalum]